MSKCAHWCKANLLMIKFGYLEHPRSFYTGHCSRSLACFKSRRYSCHSNRQGWRGYFSWSRSASHLFFLDIKQKKIGPKTLVANLQNLIQKILQHYSIESSFVEGAPGVYVGEKKIASIGLRISKGRTYHGISLNVDMDLTPFSLD